VLLPIYLLNNVVLEEQKQEMLVFVLPLLMMVSIELNLTHKLVGSEPFKVI